MGEDFSQKMATQKVLSVSDQQFGGVLREKLFITTENWLCKPAVSVIYCLHFDYFLCDATSSLKQSIPLASIS